MLPICPAPAKDVDGVFDRQRLQPTAFDHLHFIDRTRNNAKYPASGPRYP
ncbi:MAG: hypothetical protein U0798_04060 [Gemmataceae bacterium]